MKRNGIFIAIEGVDDSDENIQQADLLAKKLESIGYRAPKFVFPRHNEQSSYFVRKYLDGQFGPLDEVNPYLSSLFFSLDRYESAAKIKRLLNQGCAVVSCGFTGSNMARHGFRFSSIDEMRGYFIWLDHMEFKIFDIPRPDVSLILREALGDTNNIQAATFDHLCHMFPKDFKAVDCVRDNRVIDSRQIHNIILNTIKPMLPKDGRFASRSRRTAHSTYYDEKSENKERKYFTPKSLDGDTAKNYRAILDNILNLHYEMTVQLAKYTKAKSSRAKIHSTVNPVLPVATKPNVIVDEQESNKLGRNIVKSAKKLPSGFDASGSIIALSSFTPRSELDLVPYILYKKFDSSLEGVRAEIETWPYEKKAKIIKNCDIKTLKSVLYNWDMMTDFQLFDRLQEHKIDHLERQSLTPRYGYEVPPLVVEAGLGDKFERCFDLSLKLYSLMQDAGYEHEAQYATLLGHRMRWKMTTNAREAMHLIELRSSPQGHPGYRKAAQLMHEKIKEIHPLLASAMKFVNQGEDPELARLAAEKYSQYKLEKLDKDEKESGEA